MRSLTFASRVGGVVDGSSTTAPMAAGPGIAARATVAEDDDLVAEVAVGLTGPGCSRSCRSTRSIPPEPFGCCSTSVGRDREVASLARRADEPRDADALAPRPGRARSRRRSAASSRPAIASRAVRSTLPSRRSIAASARPSAAASAVDVGRERGALRARARRGRRRAARAPPSARARGSRPCAGAAAAGRCRPASPGAPRRADTSPEYMLRLDLGRLARERARFVVELLLLARELVALGPRRAVESRVERAERSLRRPRARRVRGGCRGGGAGGRARCRAPAASRSDLELARHWSSRVPLPLPWSTGSAGRRGAGAVAGGSGPGRVVWCFTVGSCGATWKTGAPARRAPPSWFTILPPGRCAHRPGGRATGCSAPGPRARRP